MITRSLICVLNDSEVFDRGVSLANAEYAYREIEDDKKQKMDAFKKALAAIDSRISELSHAIRDRKEYRDVEVTWQNDHGRMAKNLIRLDTGEIVETIQMSAEERQGSLI